MHHRPPFDVVHVVAPGYKPVQEGLDRCPAYRQRPRDLRDRVDVLAEVAERAVAKLHNVAPVLVCERFSGGVELLRCDWRQTERHLLFDCRQRGFDHFFQNLDYNKIAEDAGQDVDFRAWKSSLRHGGGHQSDRREALSGLSWVRSCRDARARSQRRIFERTN